MEESLPHIIEGCQRNDRKCQKMLYDKYVDKLYAVAMSYTAQAEDAQDILHDSFIKIFKYLPTTEIHTMAKVEPWMKRVVINTAIDYLRRKKKIYFTDNVHEMEIPRQPVTDSVKTNDLYQLLQMVPSGARTIFNLFAVEGYSHKEIAEMLAISESTSKTQYRRARLMMQELVNKYYER